MKNVGLAVLVLLLLAGSVWAYRHFSREQRLSQDFPDEPTGSVSASEGFTRPRRGESVISSDPMGGYLAQSAKRPNSSAGPLLTAASSSSATSSLMTGGFPFAVDPAAAAARSASLPLDVKLMEATG
jgi:hypothetical protein